MISCKHERLGEVIVIIDPFFAFSFQTFKFVVVVTVYHIDFSVP